MSLRRCFEQALKLLAAAAVLAAAGCASTGARDEGTGAAATAAQPEIPAQAQTLFEQAVSVMAAGDYDEAELRLKEFLLQYPAYPGAYVDLAIIQAKNGDDPAAQQSIDAALALDPDNPAALNQLGMLLRRKGKFGEAEAAYLKAVTAAPDYALAHYNLGVLNELYLQHLDAALQHFETYQDLVGGDEEVEKWIADLKRRVTANQRTANAAE